MHMHKKNLLSTCFPPDILDFSPHNPNLLWPTLLEVIRWGKVDVYILHLPPHFRNDNKPSFTFVYLETLSLSTLCTRILDASPFVSLVCFQPNQRKWELPPDTHVSIRKTTTIPQLQPHSGTRGNASTYTYNFSIAQQLFFKITGMPSANCSLPFYGWWVWGVPLNKINSFNFYSDASAY